MPSSAVASAASSSWVGGAKVTQRMPAAKAPRQILSTECQHRFTANPYLKGHAGASGFGPNSAYLTGKSLRFKEIHAHIDSLPLTSTSRGYHGRLAVAPLIANQRCYGEGPASLPGGSRAAQERAALTPKTARNPHSLSQGRSGWPLNRSRWAADRVTKPVTASSAAPGWPPRSRNPSVPTRTPATSVHRNSTASARMPLRSKSMPVQDLDAQPALVANARTSGRMEGQGDSPIDIIPG